MKRLNALKSILFIFGMIIAVLGYGQESKALDNGAGYITVSNITSTSCDVDWSKLATKDLYKTPESYSLYWWSSSLKAGGKEVLVLENTKATKATVTNLPSGTKVEIIVRAYYPDKLFTSDFTWITTPGATSTPTQKPTTPTTPSYPSTTTPTKPSTTTPSKPATVSLTTPVIGQATLLTSSGKAQAVPSYFSSATQTFEWRICDKKSNAVIKTSISSPSYPIATFYGLSSRKIYYIQCRSKAYTSGGYVYSNWSSPAYVISQPAVDTSKKLLKSSSIKVKYKKISGAKDYTIYMRKTGTTKWTKIKTTKKASYTVKKLKGKGLNLYKNRYQYCVVANAKVNGKTIHSAKSEIIGTTVRYGSRY